VDARNSIPVPRQLRLRAPLIAVVRLPMGTDYLVAWLSSWKGLLTLLVFLLAATGALRIISPSAFTRFGIRRIIWGYGGAIGITAVLAVFDAAVAGQLRLEEGQITCNSYDLI
jgi:hypothetical protein